MFFAAVDCVDRIPRATTASASTSAEPWFFHTPDVFMEGALRAIDAVIEDIVSGFERIL